MYNKMSRKKQYILGVLICLLCLFFYLVLHGDEAASGKQKDSSSWKYQSLQDIFSLDNFNEHPVAGDNDPFSSRDFLNKKLVHLVSFTRYALNPKQINFNKTKFGKILSKNKIASSNFSYVLNDLMVTVNVHNFFSYLWGCKEVHNGLQFQELIYETNYKQVYRATHEIYKISVEISKVDVDELVSAKCGSSDSEHSQHNLDRCFLLKNRKVLEEAAMLMQLSHQNVVKVLGLCVERPTTSERHGVNGPLPAAGVVLMKETGVKINMEQLKMLPWEDRLKICHDLASLAHHLSTSSLGNLLLTSWSPDNFVQSFKSGLVKLAHINQLVYGSEPYCTTSEECLIDGIRAGISCEEHRCDGYNAMKNMLELNRAFFSQLLVYGVPVKDTEQISNLLADLSALKLSSTDFMLKIKKLLPDFHGLKQASDSLSVQEPGSKNNPADVSLRRLPDGSQVDSWEQHESKVSINEVNVAAIAKEELSESVDDADKHEKVQDQTVMQGFKKIENADYPGRYDYYCPYSKAEWGCVMSLQSPNEAINKCVQDPKCKAFVTIPHLRKEGWIIAILKSDNSKPVDHAGTTVYIRADGESPPSPLSAAPDIAANDKVDCLSGPSLNQQSVRAAREQALMKACGWEGMADKDWEDMIAECKVEDANTFKPVRGKLAIGGQINIKLRHESTVRPALFLAKRGPEEYEVSQLAVYQVDRMLGLYKTVPAVERLLSQTELAAAGFPVDIGGNQFDQFRQMKDADKSLRGVILPQIPERVTVVHHISVPRLSGITNAVTPFSKKQWDDIEYLLLGFLAAIPVPAKGHQSLHGHLIHVKTENAFLNDNNDYLSYLYNCQFPAHVIATLRYARSNHCDIDAQIRTHLLLQGTPRIADTLNRNIKRLMDLVDQCVTKFGKETVLYETRS